MRRFESCRGHRPLTSIKRHPTCDDRSGAAFEECCCGITVNFKDSSVFGIPYADPSGHRSVGYLAWKDSTMTSKTLERNVIDELSWDPMINSEGIAVSACDGTITLRGAVNSFREK